MDKNQPTKDQQLLYCDPTEYRLKPLALSLVIRTFPRLKFMRKSPRKSGWEILKKCEPCRETDVWIKKRKPSSEFIFTNNDWWRISYFYFPWLIWELSRSLISLILPFAQCIVSFAPYWGEHIGQALWICWHDRVIRWRSCNHSPILCNGWRKSGAVREISSRAYWVKPWNACRTNDMCAVRWASHRLLPHRKQDLRLSATALSATRLLG